jgi:Rod binding domain-containing protein
MELHRVKAPLPLARAAPQATPKEAKVAAQFEALIVHSVLQSARNAKLGDDGLGATGDNVRDMVDAVRADAIARSAPLGVAKLLNAGPAQ